MKQIFYITLTLSILMGCQPKKTNTQKIAKTEKVNSVDKSSKKPNSTNEQVDNSIFIKDSSDYSAKFLEAMKKSGIKKISLVDSFLVLGQTDTVTFPQIPVIGKKTVLTARKDKIAIALTIERINQTTINYRLEMVEFGNSSFNYRGQAELSPQFYLEAETDESSLSGMSYLSTQFKDIQDSCYTYIRLGKEEESGSFLLGKLIKNCNGKLRDIGLSDFPTLVEK